MQDAVSPYSRYDDSFQQHGESPKALKWQNYAAAARRFRQLVADVDIHKKSVLDVGCGMGDLIPFLYAKSQDFSYLGVDQSPNFITIARNRYDGHTFAVADPFTENLPGTYDIVLSSGVLSSSGPDWLHARQAKIEQLFTYCNEALVFNMAGWTKPSAAVKNIGYANVKEMLDFCMELTPKVILRNHYNEQDFTICLFK